MRELYSKKDNPNYIIEIIGTDNRTGVLTAVLQNGKQTKLTSGTLIRQYELVVDNSYQKVDIMNEDK